MSVIVAPSVIIASFGRNTVIVATRIVTPIQATYVKPIVLVAVPVPC